MGTPVQLIQILHNPNPASQGLDAYKAELTAPGAAASLSAATTNVANAITQLSKALATQLDQDSKYRDAL